MRNILIGLVGLILAGCVTTAPFDQRAYETTIDLKIDSLVLIEQSSEHYTNHVAEAEALQIRIRKAHEYAKGKPDNDETVAQWALMADPDKNLMAGFMKRWESKGQMKPLMVENIKPGIAEAYDAIIELEAAKLED
jgi:hypothetical protein